MPGINDAIFKVGKLTVSGEDIVADLDMDAGSEIFTGHFPGQPVVPGACMLQILKDVFEDALKQRFRLKKAGQLKFTNVLIPQGGLQIQMYVNYKPADDESYTVSAKLSSGDIIFFKFQGSFVKA